MSGGLSDSGGVRESVVACARYTINEQNVVENTAVTAAAAEEESEGWGQAARGDASACVPLALDLHGLPLYVETSWQCGLREQMARRT